MALLPRATFAKLLACSWLLTCLGLLAFAWVQRDIHDMPVAIVLLLVLVSFPIGLSVSAGIGLATAAVEAAFSIRYDPFLDLVPIWIAVCVSGYLQWFVFVPFLWRRTLGRPKSF